MEPSLHHRIVTMHHHLIVIENNYLAEMWSGSEEGSYLRLIDCCITQL
jgi:hypothetical protein